MDFAVTGLVSVSFNGDRYNRINIQHLIVYRMDVESAARCPTGIVTDCGTFKRSGLSARRLKTCSFIEVPLDTIYNESGYYSL